MEARTLNVDWSNIPVVWIPNQKLASFALNATHIMLPPGELWFCRLFNKALPHIQDEQLKQQVKLFVAQEGAHAQGHRKVLKLYEDQGWDFSISHQRLNFIFGRLLGERMFNLWQPRGKWVRRWLRMRIGMVAGIEHLTCVFGNWILNNKTLEAAGANKAVLDLLVWHGAEEIEHRTVAYDLYKHMGGGRLSGMFWYVLALLALITIWVRATKVFLVQDQALTGERGNYGFKAYLKAGQEDYVPPFGFMLKSFLRYFKWSYHPEQEGNTQQAEAVLTKMEQRFEAT